MTEDEQKLAFLEGQVAGLTSYIAEIMARMPAGDAEKAWEDQHFPAETIAERNMTDDVFAVWQLGYLQIKNDVAAIMPTVRERAGRRG